MITRGRNKYVPRPVLDRLLEIKKREGYQQDVQAWDKMSRLIDIGGNVDDFYSQLFGERKRRKNG